MSPVILKPAELAFCGSASSFLQSDFWGSFKARFGWKPYSFCAEWAAAGFAAASPENSEEYSGYTPVSQKQNTIFPLMVLYRRLAPGIGFVYVPWGPELPPDYTPAERYAAASELASALKSFIPKNTALIRFDFPWLRQTDETGETDKTTEEKLAENIFRKYFTRAPADIQPPDSVIADLVPDEKTILSGMKPKWRYNIGLAEKKGVSVRSVPANVLISDTGNSDSGDLAAYYRLYKETAVRDGISIHGLEYYQTLFKEAANHNIDIRLYMASHNGEDIAGIVTLFRGNEAVYLYGASSNNKRNLMAPYALQWKAMQDAKAAGCLYYDFYGIPPKPPEDDPNHPMAGLYRFKTGFIGDITGDTGEGGKIIHRPGCWDYSCRPFVKALYCTAEKTRKKIWDFKKRLKRR